MLTLALAAVLAADAAPAECAWKEGKQAPTLTEDMGRVEVTYSYDATWFRCAKKSDGKLELIWSVGEGGNFVPQPGKPLTTYSGRESVRDLCATPGLKQVQAQFKGTGAMEKLEWSSGIVEVYCQKCQWAGDDNMLVLHTKALTPPGQWTIQATFDPKWYACAKDKAQIELRLFAGQTREEVKNAKEPTHVVKGVDGPKIKKAFPKGPICKGNPKFVGYEFGGTGEFRVLPAKGRPIQEAQCQ